MVIINLFGARFQYPQDKQLSEWLTAERAVAQMAPQLMVPMHRTCWQLYAMSTLLPADLLAYSTNLTEPPCMAPPGWLSHRKRNRGCPSRFRGNNSSACCKRIPSD